MGSLVVAVIGLVFPAILLVLSVHLVRKHWQSSYKYRFYWHVLHLAFSIAYIGQSLLYFLVDQKNPRNSAFSKGQWYCFVLVVQNLYFTMWCQLNHVWLGYLGKNRGSRMGFWIDVSNITFVLSPGGLSCLPWLVQTWSSRPAHHPFCGLNTGVLNGHCGDVVFQLRIWCVIVGWFYLSVLTILTGNRIWPLLSTVCGDTRVFGFSKAKVTYCLCFNLPAVFISLKSFAYLYATLYAYTHSDNGYDEIVSEVAFILLASVLSDFAPSGIAMLSLWDQAVGLPSSTESELPSRVECLLEAPSWEPMLGSGIKRWSDSSTESRDSLVGSLRAPGSVEDLLVCAVESCATHTVQKAIITEKMQPGPENLEIPTLFVGRILEVRGQAYEEWKHIVYYPMMEKQVQQPQHTSMRSALAQLDESGAIGRIQKLVQKMETQHRDHLKLLEANTVISDLASEELQSPEASGASHWFKPSRNRKAQAVCCLPINLQWYSAHMEGSEIPLIECVTVGAPAAHCLGFGSVKEPDAQTNLVEKELKASQLKLALSQRQDVCHAMALGTVCSVATQKLIWCMSAGREDWIQCYERVGMLVHWVSLLSTIAKEEGMIRDMMEACEWVQRAVVLHWSPDLFVSQVELKEDGSVLIKMPLPEGCGNREIQFRLHMALLNQGVNEQQTAAQTMPGQRVQLQDSINRAWLQNVKDYFQLVQAEGTQILDLQEVASALEHTSRLIETPSQAKDVMLFTKSVELSKSLGSALLVSCKSAKDRTSMLVSYLVASEAAKRLGVVDSEGFITEVTDELRSQHGLRLRNCEMNTGKARFAFNSLQRQFLPPELRPPKHVAGSGVQN